MNDLALYQLERAIDALSNMAKILRDDNNDQIVFPSEGGDSTHSEYYYDYDRNDSDRSNPFEFTIQDLKYNSMYSGSTVSSNQYTDDEIAAMCDQAERDQLNLEQSKEQIYKNYRAAVDEYNKLNEKYKSLVESHEELQDLFYTVDYEYDELKVNYNQLQDNYHKTVRELSKVINNR